MRRMRVDCARHARRDELGKCLQGCLVMVHDMIESTYRFHGRDGALAAMSIIKL